MRLGATSDTGGFPAIYRPSFMSGILCDGDEKSLFECSYQIQGLSDCSDDDIAGIKCEGTYPE